MSHKLICISKSPDDTVNNACELAKKINKPALIGLMGGLGVGKTVFAKGIAFGLGVKELVTSPTFLGISEYYSGRLPFVHMDFYKKVQKKESIESYLRSGSVVLVEWMENYSLLFSSGLNLDISVYIEYVKDKNRLSLENERKITLEQ